MIFSLNMSTCRRHVATFDISGLNLPLPADMTRPTFAAKILWLLVLCRAGAEQMKLSEQKDHSFGFGGESKMDKNHPFCVHFQVCSRIHKEMKLAKPVLHAGAHRIDLAESWMILKLKQNLLRY